MASGLTHTNLVRTPLYPASWAQILYHDLTTQKVNGGFHCSQLFNSFTLHCNFAVRQVFLYMKRIVIFTLVAIAVQTSSVRAQHWSQLTIPPPATKGGLPSVFITPYFLNSNIGFAFSSGITTPSFSFTNFYPNLAKTTDGGQTWTEIPFFGFHSYPISQLYFTSLLHGYAATGSDQTNNPQPISDRGGIFETFDGGINWKHISKDGRSCMGVYATDNIVVAAVARNNYPLPGPILYSRDDGATWDSITNVTGLTLDTNPRFQLIYGNRDSLVATVYLHDSDTYLVFSTDLGGTWQSRPLDRDSLYYRDGPHFKALYIAPHSCDIIRQSTNIQDYLDDVFSYVKSSTDYRVWTPSLMHEETGTWIAGNNCAMYLANAGANAYSVPLYRSTDGGNSWSGLPGNSVSEPQCTEMDDYDWRNISVVGYGSVVYAANVVTDTMRYSQTFYLWKTTDGGDGTLSIDQLSPRVFFDRTLSSGGRDTLTISCDTGIITVFNQNLRCAYTKLTDISIQGLDSSEYTIKRIRHNACQDLPDTTLFLIASSNPGKRDLTIHAHFIDDEYTEIDTSFSILLDVSASGRASSTFSSARIINDSLNITVYLPIYLLHFGAMNDVDMIMHYPSTGSLKYLNGVTYNGKSIDVPGSRWAGRAALHFGAADLNAAPDSLIGYANFQWTPYEYTCDEIDFDSIDTHSAESPCSSGEAAPFKGIIGSYKSCGISGVAGNKINSTPMDFSIYPNPAKNIIDISLNEHNGKFHYELFDAMGISRKNGITSAASFQIDVSDLADGNYYLRLSAKDGAPVTKWVVVMK